MLHKEDVGAALYLRKVTSALQLRLMRLEGAKIMRE